VSRLLFTIQDNRKYGKVLIEYDRYDDNGSRELEVEFQVLSIWQDSTNGNAIKAHLICQRNNPAQRQFMADVLELGKVNCPQGFCFTGDRIFLRYGKQPGEVYSGNERDTYEQFWVYDSKAKAIQDILDRIARYQTIGGLNFVSLSRVSDELLKEAGYEMIPDMMRYGIPMWKGSFDKALGGDISYSAGADKARKQFLDLLARIINQKAS
jgi:hypothetical protein